MSTTPAVSVVVPTYEAPALLPATVQSILAQTFTDLELIVVDDGSGPATAACLAPFADRLRVLRKANGGQASAKNVGIAAARGELIAFCDHDDLWRPDKLARHVARHRAGPELVLTFSQVVPFTAEAGPRAPVPQHGVDGDPLAALVGKSLIPTSSAVVVRRDALLAAGGFVESYRIADDYDLWFRLAQRGPFGFLPEPLVEYRIHAGNTSRNGLLLHEEWARILADLDLAVAPATAGLRAAIRRKLVHHLVAVARHQAHAGRRLEARATLARAARLAPLSWKVRRHQLRGLLRRLLPPR